MAKVDQITFSGRVDRQVFYKLKGKPVMRSMPKKFKQTEATKASAIVFGNASRTARIIRLGLENAILERNDTTMHRRLLKEVHEWMLLGNAPQPVALLGFEFNSEGPSIAQRWNVPLTVTHSNEEGIKVEFPAFVPSKAIRVPPNTKFTICHIAATSLLPGENNYLEMQYAEFIFENSDDPVEGQSVTWHLPTPSGSLLLAAVSLEYRITGHARSTEASSRNTHDNQKKDFMPAGIVYAAYL